MIAEGSRLACIFFSLFNILLFLSTSCHSPAGAKWDSEEVLRFHRDGPLIWGDGRCVCLFVRVHVFVLICVFVLVWLACLLVFFFFLFGRFCLSLGVYMCSCLCIHIMCIRVCLFQRRYCCVSVQRA